MPTLLSRLQSQARLLKIETQTLYLAALDPRTPWYAKGLVFLVVAYALSPIDLIPDFIPVLGYLDDLIIVPAGIALALTMIPPEVMKEARQKAASTPPGTRAGIIGAVIIILLWILAIVFVAAAILRIVGKRL